MDRSASAAPAVQLLHSQRLDADPAAVDHATALAADARPELARRARTLTVAACRGWSLTGMLIDDAALVADELVTNAVRHARTFLELHLRREPAQLVIAVHDQSAAFDPGWFDRTPPPQHSDPRLGGYGLPLVRAISQHCGGYRHPDGGKVIWATLPIPPGP